MDKKIIGNYLYSVIVQLVSIIVPFITVPYISRVLIPEEIGLYNYTLNVMTYFSIFAELGFQFYGQEAIVNSRNQQEREQCFLTILKIKCIFGSCILVAYFAIVTLFLGNKVLYYYQGVAILAVIIDITWYYAGRENFKTIAMRGLFLKLASLLMLFVFVRGPHALNKYIISIQVPNLVGNLLMYPGLDVKIRDVRITSTQMLKILRSSLALLIPSILTSIYQIVDKTILGRLSSMAQVGYYSQMLKLIGLLSIIVYSIGKVVFPRMILHYQSGDTNSFQMLMRETTSFIIHIGLPISVGIYCVLDYFVPWFYGTNYLVLIDYFPIALPLILVVSLNHVFSSQLLIAINEEKKLYLLIIINILINIVLDIKLIPLWNCIGAVIASIVAEIVQFIGSIILYKRIIGGKLYSVDIMKAFLSSVGMGLCVFLFANYMNTNDIARTFVSVAIGVLAYTAILSVLKDSFVIRALWLVKRVVKKV